MMMLSPSLLPRIRNGAAMPLKTGIPEDPGITYVSIIDTAIRTAKRISTETNDFLEISTSFRSFSAGVSFLVTSFPLQQFKQEGNARTDNPLIFRRIEIIKLKLFIDRVRDSFQTGNRILKIQIADL